MKASARFIINSIFHIEFLKGWFSISSYWFVFAIAAAIMAAMDDENTEAWTTTFITFPIIASLGIGLISTVFGLLMYWSTSLPNIKFLNSEETKKMLDKDDVSIVKQRFLQGCVAGYHYQVRHSKNHFMTKRKVMGNRYHPTGIIITLLAKSTNIKEVHKIRNIYLKRLKNFQLAYAYLNRCAYIGLSITVEDITSISEKRLQIKLDQLLEIVNAYELTALSDKEYKKAIKQRALKRFDSPALKIKQEFDVLHESLNENGV